MGARHRRGHPVPARAGVRSSTHALSHSDLYTSLLTIFHIPYPGSPCPLVSTHRDANAKHYTGSWISPPFPVLVVRKRQGMHKLGAVEKDIYPHTMFHGNLVPKLAVRYFTPRPTMVRKGCYHRGSNTWDKGDNETIRLPRMQATRVERLQDIYAPIRMTPTRTSSLFLLA